MKFISDYSKYVFDGTDAGFARIHKPNEDSNGWAQETPNGDVFVVCDGMGGHAGGKKASQIAVSAIIEHFSGAKYDDPQQTLKDALHRANAQILGFASENPTFKGMGTTACILLLRDASAWIAHIGDSRIYLFKTNEKELHRVTKDHSLVQALADKGEISEEEAETDSRKNIILLALGVKEELNPSIAQVLPKIDDIFLLCSDGLTDMIDDGKIEDLLGDEKLTLYQKGEELIEMANHAGGKDNITLQLIQIEHSQHEKSEFTSYNPKSRQYEKQSDTEITSQNDGRKKPKNIRALIIAVVIVLLLSGLIILLLNLI